MERYRCCNGDVAYYRVEETKYSRAILLVDTFMIFLNLSASYSIVPYLLFQASNRYINMLGITVLNIGYIFTRLNIWNRNENRSVHWRIFAWYAILQVCGMIAAGLTDTGWRAICIHFLLNTSFYIILLGLYRQYVRCYSYFKTFWLLSRGYVVLVMLSVIGSIVLFLLVKMGVEPYRNDVTMRYDLFFDNYVKFGDCYYYPFCLSVIDAQPDVRIPFFQEDGLITGLYHEPHCMTFMVFPAVFLLLYYNKQRLLLIALYLFVLLLEASTANIIAMMGCMVVYWLYLVKQNLKHAIAIGGLMFLGGLLLFSKGDVSNFDFIVNKIHSGSATYSLSTIKFAMSPQTLWGASFLNLDYLNGRIMDVGYIPFFLNLFFLIGCLASMFRLFVSKSSFKLAVLLFAVYFFIHSAKIVMVTYSLTMLMFVVFMLAVVPCIPDNLLCRGKTFGGIEK